MCLEQPEGSAATQGMHDSEPTARCSKGPSEGGGQDTYFLDKRKKLRDPHSCDLCYATLPFSLSAKTDWASTVVFKLFFPSSRAFPLCNMLCGCLACNEDKSRAAKTGLQSPLPSYSSDHFSPPYLAAQPQGPSRSLPGSGEHSLKTSSLWELHSTFQLWF